MHFTVLKFRNKKSCWTTQTTGHDEHHQSKLKDELADYTTEPLLPKVYSKSGSGCFLRGKLPRQII
jgi:hypothetical protein